MKFKVSKASDWVFEDSVEINTLEDLLHFVETKYKEHENEKDELGLFNNFGGVVLSKEDNEWEITLYNDYLE